MLRQTATVQSNRQLSRPRWLTSAFQYFKESRTFQAAASDLQLRPGFWFREIVLVSHKTMLDETFTLQEDDLEKYDGEIMTYRNERINVNVIIYNDF